MKTDTHIIKHIDGGRFVVSENGKACAIVIADSEKILSKVYLLGTFKTDLPPVAKALTDAGYALGAETALWELPKNTNVDALRIHSSAFPYPVKTINTCTPMPKTEFMKDRGETK